MKQLVKSLLKSGVLFAGVAAISMGALAQQPINSIEVLVNDEPVSSFDINQRLRLVIAVAGGVKSEAEFLKVREQVIQSLVDERLQLQEAKEVELEVSEAQLEEFFARRAQGVGQTPEQFETALAGIGSSKKTMQDQMKAEIAWSQLVQGKFGSFVSVSEEEVEAQIKRMYENKGKFEYRLAEIVLLVDSPEQEESIKANSKELVDRIRGGASFPDLAQQLSASSTAAVGGDLGWVTATDLSGAYADAVRKLSVGEVADPIRTAGGYLILALRDRRRILTVDPLDTQVAINQLHLTPEKVDEPETAEKFSSTVDGLHLTGAKCEDTAALAEKSGADGPTELGIMRLRDMQPEIRTAIENLDIGQASPLIKMEDGWRVFLLCGKQEPQVQEPDFDTVYAQIEQQRLSMIARRFLRDIRRDAIVDYR